MCTIRGNIAVQTGSMKPVAQWKAALMSNVALYTFGLLDPAAGPTRMADFARRAGEIYGASDHAPGFVARAEKAAPGSAAHTAGEDFGRWGPYALPLDLPDFAGHDPKIHIATLSLWRDADSARLFVYEGFHREALKMRHDWFLRGPGRAMSSGTSRTARCPAGRMG